MADFSAIRKEECRESELPNGCELNGSHTVVLQSVINEIKEHGRSSMHAEVCGVLVGSLCWDGRPYLLIDGRIEGKHASHQSGSVTFTSETWDFIHEELAAKYPDRKIVGWYHTHPGFGIFLSNMDAFIHENFFSFPWEPAYVFDPQAETDGFFFQVGTELVQEEVSVSVDAAPSVVVPPVGFKSLDRIVVGDLPRRRRSYTFLGITATVHVCCVAAVVWILIDKVGKSEQVAKAAETKSEVLRCALNEKEAEIKKHRRKTEELSVCKEMREKELAVLKDRMNAITSERKDLEVANKEKRSEVDKLKTKCANLEKEIREKESQISKRNIEIDRIKADLVSVREQKHQLELRIKAQESLLCAEKLGKSTCLNIMPTKNVETPEAIGKKERRWYFWLIFWE